jgi:glycosyltransferase involved in cell wall biosynthesis
LKLEILFVSRNYPPRVGGLEAFSYNLIKEFEAHEITHKIALDKSYIHLLWFLPYALLKGFYITRKNGMSLIHLCDGFLAPIGVILKYLTGAQISITIHGLDITYKPLFYQMIIPYCVARLEKVICVSHSTRNECIRRGISPLKCIVISNGIRPEEFYLPLSRDDLRCQLERVVGVPLKGKIVLATVGRLVPRKGVAWFVDSVIPCLDTSYIYLIAGDGPEYRRIQAILKRHHIRDRVFLLGRVSDEERDVIYNASDILIMPNITIPDDVEGFGIAAIEAGSCGLPVVASRIQGIQDAVIDGMTGYLVEERDTERFLKKIEKMDLIKENVRSIVNARFDWKQIYRQYRSVLMMS